MQATQINTLADLVACRARVDTTEPDPKNLRAGWRTDQLLQDIEALVIGQAGEPAAYAIIARQARLQMTASEMPAVVAALVDLAEFNGERRLPDAPGREELLNTKACHLEEMVSDLPEGPSKVRCQELLLYHVGVFNDAYGHFAQAAEMQKQAAARADFNGNKPGAAICGFMEALYQLKHAFVVGQPKEKLVFTFSILEGRFARLVEATRGTAFEVQWGQANGPMHIIEACVWLDWRDHPNWSKWAMTACDAANKLGAAYEPGAKFIQAADSYYKIKDVQSELDLGALLPNISQSNELRATVLLILARSAAAKEDWLQMAEFIAKIPEQGAQHVRSIAQRLLS